MRGRGTRFLAIENNAVIYHTDSWVGMRDQAMRLLSLSKRCNVLTIVDTERNVTVEWDRVTIHDWRI